VKKTAGDDVSVEEQVLAELTGLRSTVPGVTGAVVATSDGLLVAGFLPEPEQSPIAALISTVAGVARQAVLLTGGGQLQEAAIRGDSGALVVYSIGGRAVLAVLAGPDLNVALLQHRIRPVVIRLEVLAAGFARFATIPEPAGPVSQRVRVSENG
jgi:predicted regulator of Ras-like GTPase activity (Roadblock/LC7/MglB family)